MHLCIKSLCRAMQKSCTGKLINFHSFFVFGQPKKLRLTQLIISDIINMLLIGKNSIVDIFTTKCTIFVSKCFLNRKFFLGNR